MFIFPILSPAWPGKTCPPVESEPTGNADPLPDIFPPINCELAVEGKQIFDVYCLSCHERIDRTSKNRRVIANMEKIEAVKTDPGVANNSVEATGYSGILENQYVGTGSGDILLNRRAPVAALLTKATANVVTTPDQDHVFIQREAERLFDILLTVLDNVVKPSIKRGNYEPDTTVDPFASLRAYKGRSLNGIWATAPYLHNGSVPTLYHLLLPKNPSCEDEDGELILDGVQSEDEEIMPEYPPMQV